MGASTHQPDRDLIACFLVLLVKGVFRVLALDNRITERASPALRTQLQQVLLRGDLHLLLNGLKRTAIFLSDK